MNETIILYYISPKVEKVLKTSFILYCGNMIGFLNLFKDMVTVQFLFEFVVILDTINDFRNDSKFKNMIGIAIILF